MRCPAGSSERSMRAVKSVASSAAGPTTRRRSLNEPVVEYSTIRRAGRSVRLHTRRSAAMIEKRQLIAETKDHAVADVKQRITFFPRQRRVDARLIANRDR